MDDAAAKHFAEEWVSAWNGHDLETILSHYADPPSHTSPLIALRLGIADGTIKDSATLRDYFRRGLESAPALRFDLIETFVGVGSVGLVYTNQVGKRILEVMHLDANGKVVRSVVCWA